MEYRPWLNEDVPLVERLADALTEATRLELAVAYAKASGAGELLRLPIPRGSRAVVGLGFGLTDPVAVEQLESAGMDVRLVADSQILSASSYHPKLYLTTRPRHLVVLSGSANLTGAGLRTNVEQYEELRFAEPSTGSDRQRERYERLWDHGTPATVLRRSGDWEDYRQRARDRRVLELEDRQRLLRLHADTGRLIGQLARRETARKPGYLAITHPDWWRHQLRGRFQSDVAYFWRRGTNRFRALPPGGVFFHLVPDGGGREELRAVRGFSYYPGPGGFDVGTAEDLWYRYGQQLGVAHLADLYARLDVAPGRLLGVIALESMTEFDRPVTLEELRSEGIPFARNIVSGKGLTLVQTARLFDLGGLGVGTRLDQAAEAAGPYGEEREGA